MKWTAAVCGVLIVVCAGYWIGRHAAGRGVGDWIFWALGLLLLVEVALAAYWRGTSSSPAPMRHWVAWVAYASVALAIVAGALFGGFWFGDRSASPGSSTSVAPASNASPAPVVPVQTVPLRDGTLQETITVYGRVVAQPGETHIVSLPFESRVQRMLVTAGEQVQKGSPLAQVEPSPGARLQLQQAQRSVSTAQSELKLVGEKYDQKLATQSQLVQAQQAFHSATLTLENLRKEGVGPATTLAAQTAGIISKVVAQEGQLTPAGSPLLELAVQDRIEVRLGVEPEDIPLIHPDQRVELTPVHLDPGQSVNGHVRLITKQVNSATELIDVFVSLPANAGLTLSQYVRATLVTAARRGMIVPRQALLTGQNGYAIFTVHGGHAVRHPVHLGLQTDTQIQIIGDHLTAGEQVVLAGNYELQPGMAVSLESHP